MKQILHDIGLGDGEGNTSVTRVISLLLVLGYIAAKFYNAYITKTPVTFDGTDLGFMGTIGGILVAKTQVEKTTTVKPNP